MHWKPGVANLVVISAPLVVITTTCGAATGDKVGITASLGFECVLTLPHIPCDLVPNGHMKKNIFEQIPRSLSIWISITKDLMTVFSCLWLFSNFPEINYTAQRNPWRILWLLIYFTFRRDIHHDLRTVAGLYIDCLWHRYFWIDATMNLICTFVWRRCYRCLV